MKKKQQKNRIFGTCRGMTLVEVIVAMGLMVMLFSMFAISLNIANGMNRNARQNDAALAEAESSVYSIPSSGTGSVTFSDGGGATYTYNVELFEGASADGDVQLRRFEP